MPGKAVDQLAFDEKVVVDADLEAALEEREAAREKVAAARKALEPLDDEAKNRIDALDLGVDTAIRVGRFRIVKTEAPARSVAFDVESKERIRISTVEATS